jgi:hypothetical protein
VPAAAAALPIPHLPAALTQEEEDEVAGIMRGLTIDEQRGFAAMRTKMVDLDGSCVTLDFKSTPPAVMGGIAAALAFDKKIKELQLVGQLFPQLPAVISCNRTIQSLVVRRASCGNAPLVMQAFVENPLCENLAFEDFQRSPEMTTAVEAAVDLFAKHFACPESLGLTKLVVGHKSAVPSYETPENLSLVNVLPLFRALAGPRLCQHMLTGLSLTGLFVSDPAMTSEVFAKALASPSCELRHVELFSNFDPVVIGEALKLNRSIVRLQWAGKELGPLSDLLCVNSTIFSVDTTYCFGASLAQSKAFAAAVPLFPGVRFLKFPYELVDDDTLLEFGQSLARAQHIRSIVLCRATSNTRRLGGATLREFAGMLALSPGIENFGFSANWMDDPLAFVDEMHGLTLGRFRFDGNFETAQNSFTRVPGPRVTHVTVRNGDHTEDFRFPSAFPLASLLNQVGDRFGTSVHRLSLVRCSDHKPVISSHSAIERARQTFGEYFGEQDPVELYVSRGDFAAVGLAFQQAKEALESFVSTQAETARVRQGRKRSADGDLGAPSKATRAEGQEEVSDSATPAEPPPPPLITERTLRENGVSLLGTIPIDAMRILDYFVNGSG